MADNLRYLPSSAPNAVDVATRDGGAQGHLQRVVIASASLADLPGDASEGLWVNVKALAPLPAGANTIGAVNVAQIAAGANNIGDVDVLSVVPGVAANALGKAVNSPAGATDTVVGIGVVRDDSLAPLAEADGDYTYLRTDSQGRLWTTGVGGTQYATQAVYANGNLVNLSGFVRRDAAGADATIADGQVSFAAVTDGHALKVHVVNAGSGGTAQSDDDPLGLHTPVGFLFDATPPSVTDGKVGIGRMSAHRAQYVTLRLDGSDAPAGDTTNPLVVRLRDAGGDEVAIDGSGLLVQANIAANQKITLRDPSAARDAEVQTPGATVLNWLAAMGSRVRATAAVSEAPESDGDIMPAAVDGIGRGIIVPWAHPANTFQVPGTASNGTTAVPFKASAGASTRNYLSRLAASNKSATHTELLVLDDVTEIARFPLPANSGFSITITPPLRGSAATAMQFKLADPAPGANVQVSGGGYASQV